MLKISSIFNSKNIPWAGLGCLLILIGLEIIVRLNAERIRPLDEATLVHKHQHLLNNKTPYDCIMLGDSRLLGMNAKVVSEIINDKLKSNHSCFNYSFPNHDIRGYFFLLQQYLSIKKAPKFIIFSSAPNALTFSWNLESPKRPRESLHRFAELYSLNDTFQAFNLQTAYQISLIKLERLSYLITYRGIIKKLILQPASVLDTAHAAIDSLDETNGGALFNTITNVTSEEAIKKSDFFRMPLKIDDRSANWLEKFFKLTDENNIRVFILNAPLPTPIWQKYQHNGSYNGYIEHFNKLKVRFKNITVIEPVLPMYPVSSFLDDQHLNEEGMVNFTYESADKLTEALKDNLNYRAPH